MQNTEETRGKAKRKNGWLNYGQLVMLLAPLLAVGGAFGAQYLKSDVVLDKLRRNTIISFIGDLVSPRQTIFTCVNNALVTSSYEVPEEKPEPSSHPTLLSNTEKES